MDNEVLEILKLMQQDIKEIKEDVTTLKEDVNKLKQEQIKTNERLDRIEKKNDIIYEQVIRSAEDISIIKKDLCFVEEATARNWNDIARLKAVK